MPPKIFIIKFYVITFCSFMKISTFLTFVNTFSMFYLIFNFSLKPSAKICEKFKLFLTPKILRYSGIVTVFFINLFLLLDTSNSKSTVIMRIVSFLTMFLYLIFFSYYFPYFILSSILLYPYFLSYFKIRDIL